MNIMENKLTNNQNEQKMLTQIRRFTNVYIYTKILNALPIINKTTKCNSITFTQLHFILYT